MTPETLICAEDVAPERLSALRDDALAPAEAQRLRAHIAACPACSARMSDYAALATALRQQRELEPGERIVSGVRARLATQMAPRRLRSSRRLWAGLATLAPVAAIILLFVYVFSGLAGRGRPATSATPTVRATTPVATNQHGKPVAATETPALVTLPSFTTSVSADAAWGALSPVAHYQTPNVANTAFALTALSPDATTLVGTAMPVSATPGAGGIPRVDLISYNIASGAYRPLGPHWSGYVGPWGAADAVSARFIVYGYNSQPGATCGVCNNTLWAYDRQTGASWEIEPGKQYGGDQGDFTSADHVAFTSIEGQVWVADLATHQVTLALPVGAQPITAASSPSAPAPDVRLIGFTWPYLIYDYTPAPQDPGAPATTTLRILNLQTGVNTITTVSLDTLLGPSSITTGSNLMSALVSSGVLYLRTDTEVNGVDASGAAVNTSYSALYRMSQPFASASQPELLARWQDTPTAQNGGAMSLSANARLMALGSGYVWDLAEQRLVQLPVQGASATQGALLSGDYLLLTHTVSASNPQAPIVAGVIYDTATLPVR